MPKENLILGIESSCDDTAVAIVTRAGKVMAAQIATQEYIHKEFGGVYPEYASRAHAQSIIPAIAETLAIAGIEGSELHAIGVTRGPGLIGSLQVGINAAVGLGLGWGIPVVAVNHLRGHLRSADLECSRIRFPAVMLLVSGGHTFLAHLRSQTDVVLLGSTRDDSVGEAYDKVARMLGLGYPGGPVIDRLAVSGTPRIKLPRPMIGEGFAFSFSGLKSAVARYVEKNPRFEIADVCASFVQACVEVISSKSKAAIELTRPTSFVMVGGVAASPQLRDEARKLANSLGVVLCLPPLKWSTDNGAMIALAAWDYLDIGYLPDPIVRARIPLSEL